MGGWRTLTAQVDPCWVEIKEQTSMADKLFLNHYTDSIVCCHDLSLFMFNKSDCTPAIKAVKCNKNQ